MSIGDIHIHINEDQSKTKGVPKKRTVAPRYATRKNKNKSPGIETENLPTGIQPVFPAFNKRGDSSVGIKNGIAKRGSRLSTSRSPSTVVQTAVVPNVIRPKKRKRGFFSKAASFAKKVAKASIVPGLPGVVKLARRRRRVAATSKFTQQRVVRGRTPIANATMPRIMSRPAPQQTTRRVARPSAISRLPFNRKRR